MKTSKKITLLFVCVASLGFACMHANKKQRSEKIQKNILKNFDIDSLEQVCRFLKLKDILNISLGAELQERFFEKNSAGSSRLKLRFLKALLGFKRLLSQEKKINNFITFVKKTKYYPALLHCEKLTNVSPKDLNQFVSKKILLRSLVEAVKKDDDELIEFLIGEVGVSKKISYNLVNSIYLWKTLDKEHPVVAYDTLFHVAAKYNSPRAIKKLFELDAFGITEKNYNEHTPLHVAARYCSVDVIDSLFDCGIDVDTGCEKSHSYKKSKKIESPLHLTVLHKNFRAAKKLIQLGADKKIECRGQTPLDFYFIECKIEKIKENQNVVTLLAPSGKSIYFRPFI